MTSSNCKQSLYFPKEMYNEIREEASRLDRSVSWIIVQAWRLAKSKIQDIPSVGDPEEPTSKAP
jgi:uncharacterized small protein (TIGR04563 family)